MRSVTIILIAFLLILPLVSASTTIKLRTLPGHTIYISIWSSSQENQIESPKKYLSDINGDVQHTYEGTTSPFDVLVVVKAFDVQKYREYFGPYVTGGVVQLPNLLPEGFEAFEGNESLVNNTKINNTNDTNDSVNQTNNETTGTITGDSVQEITNSSENTPSKFFTGDVAKVIYSIFGVIFIAGVIIVIIIFIVTKIRRPRKIQYGMEPVKLDVKYRPDPSGDKYLDNIEKEIENVGIQIEQYKKRNRLEEAQKRLEEKKRVLERIKRGDNIDSSSSSKEDRENKYKKRFY